jgi:hypothetical protein
VGPGQPHRRQPRGVARPGGVTTGPPADKIKAVHRALEQAGIPHAFGGALALAFYAEPRETSDIDVNVFVPVERRLEVDKALASLGTDREHPVHLFFSCDALHEEMPKKIRQVSIGGETIPLVSPEHLVVRKTILNRPKDWRDIEAILAHTGVDQAEVDAWVRRLSS